MSVPKITEVLRSSLITFGELQVSEEDLGPISNFTRLVGAYFGVDINIEATPVQLGVGFDTDEMCTLDFLHNNNKVFEYPVLFCGESRDNIGVKAITKYKSNTITGSITKDGKSRVLFFDKMFKKLGNQV